MTVLTCSPRFIAERFHPRRDRKHGPVKCHIRRQLAAAEARRCRSPGDRHRCKASGSERAQRRRSRAPGARDRLKASGSERAAPLQTVLDGIRPVQNYGGSGTGVPEPHIKTPGGRGLARAPLKGQSTRLNRLDPPGQVTPHKSRSLWKGGLGPHL